MFDALLGQMDPADPNSRILLNACLTASADFKPSDRISSSRRRAAQQINAIVSARPNFADVLRDRAAGRGFDRARLVSAANASFTSEAELIDPATGQLGLASPANYDPQLANADRMEYIRDGSEPEGYMRAVLEFYGSRRPEVVTALRAKLASAERSQWPDRVTRAFARVSLYRIHEPHVLAQMLEATWPLGELNSDSECQVANISGIPPLVVGDIFPRLLAEPHNAGWTANYNLRLVVLQRWAAARAPRRGPARGARRATPWSSSSPGSTSPSSTPAACCAGWSPAASAAPPGRGGCGSAARRGRARCRRGFDRGLRRLRGRRTDFLPADRTRIQAALGGARTPDDVLDAILEPTPVGRVPRGAAGPVAPDANVDTDGDGTNDVHVTHMTRRGANAAVDVELRQRPDPAAAVTSRVPRGTTLFVIGRAEGGFLAVEDGATTASCASPTCRCWSRPERRMASARDRGVVQRAAGVQRQEPRSRGVERQRLHARDGERGRLAAGPDDDIVARGPTRAPARRQRRRAPSGRRRRRARRGRIPGRARP